MNATSFLQQQLDFIAYIQRIFVEGDFSATYKFALLHALADLCVERPYDPSRPLTLSLDEIAAKFIELYWQHTMPYSATELSPSLLKQNSGRQSKLVTELSLFRAQGLHNPNQLRQQADWPKLLRQSKDLLKVGPLWRLQILGRKVEPMLYQHTQSSSEITLNIGIDECFRRFYDLVIGLTRTHWVQKIRTYPDNNGLIGDKGNLEAFLFGSERKPLQKVNQLLQEIQQGRCFYCDNALNSDKGQVDHFIPWARYPVDLAHNFVLAHSRCNNNKRAYLAASCHREHWHQQNIVQFGALIDAELSSHITCDMSRSQAVTDWAYQQAALSRAQLWLGADQFEPYPNKIIPEFEAAPII